MAVEMVEAIATESETNEETTEDESGETTEEILPGEMIKMHLLVMIGIPRILDHQPSQRLCLHPTEVRSCWACYKSTPDFISEPLKHASSSKGRPNLDPDSPDSNEDGEAMDDVNDEDAAMMAMMGVTGFGTTKVNSATTPHI